MTDHHSLCLLLMLAFVVGTVFGSFISVVVHRLPDGEDVVFKPSYCPRCNTPLTATEMFPLLSYLFQRGRCRHCRTPIHWRYPAIEAVMGLAFLLITYLCGATMEALILALLSVELAILILIDFEHYIIPDSIQIALGVTGIAYAIATHVHPLDMAMSSAAGLALGLALHYGYLYLRKKDALGWGDVKFFAVAGLWLPLTAMVPFLLLGGILGTLTGLFWRALGRGAIFPFGPALAVSLFINVLVLQVMHGDLIAVLTFYFTGI